jgi:hypothetical protein
MAGSAVQPGRQISGCRRNAYTNFARPRKKLSFAIKKFAFRKTRANFWRYPERVAAASRFQQKPSVAWAHSHGVCALQQGIVLALASLDDFCVNRAEFFEEVIDKHCAHC